VHSMPQNKKPTRIETRVEDSDIELVDYFGSDRSEDDNENSAEAFKIIHEHKKRQAKKVNLRSVTFLANKNAIYIQGRSISKDIVKNGIAHLETARAAITALKNEEIFSDKYIKDYMPLRVAQGESFDRLITLYPALLEELGPQRSKQIDAASNMLHCNGPRRQEALKQFSKNARAHVEQARQTEKNATDATALIKHYKDLLHA